MRSESYNFHVMKKKEEQRVSPLAIIAFGLIIIAIVTIAFVSGRQDDSEDSATAVQEQQDSKPADEPYQESPASTQNQSYEFRMPPFLSDPDGVPLQQVKDPSSVSPAAQSSYVVAQSKPRLLAQLPCFCYCDRFGHGSLHDCFVTNHAETCDICMKEALHADEMDRQGMSPTAIREAIVAQYHPRKEDHEGHSH